MTWAYEFLYVSGATTGDVQSLLMDVGSEIIPDGTQGNLCGSGDKT